MQKHPFNGSVFQSIWSKHFNQDKTPISFNSIKELKFYRKRGNTYINIGKNITNGNFYELQPNAEDYKGKTFIVYDVPSYFSIPNLRSKGLQLKKVKQYKGFTSQLDSFDSFDAFFNAQFKSSSRYKYRRNIKRLEANFDISYKIYHGHFNREDYEVLCKFLKKNLSRRFGSLGLDNNILSKWDYYYDLMYDMVVNKEAAMTAIYDKEKPIGISFSFLSNHILLFAITSFDIDYMRYNLGHTTIIKLMQWSFDNGYKVYDFSKGEYIYKDRWTNHDYNYECHILYDSKSLVAQFKANYYNSYFKLKQYLRDKNVNRLYTQLKFKLKNSKKVELDKFRIEKLDPIVDTEGLQVINLSEDQFSSVRYELYQYLYLNPEKVDNIVCYRDTNNPKIFYALGTENKIKLEQLN